MKTFYFDTSIWLDIHERRGAQGEQAFRLMKLIIDNDLRIAYSDLNIKELKHLGYPDSIVKIAKPSNTEHVHIYRPEMVEARRLARKRRVPLKDCLHAIIARDNDLQLIATDNHFDQLRDISHAKKPQDFI